MFILLLVLVGWPLVVAGAVLYTVWHVIDLGLAGRFVALSLAMVTALAWTLNGDGQMVSVVLYSASALGWFLTLVRVSQPTYR